MQVHRPDRPDVLLADASSESFSPDFRLLFESSPGLYLVLTPDLKIVAVNDAYLRATMTKRKEVLGRGIFDVFPDNPDDPSATGVGNLRASLERVLRDRVADSMAVQKYDIRRPESEGGEFEVRYWSPVNSPVFNADGALVYIIHRVDDVTEFIRLKEQGIEQERVTARLLTRGEEMEAEIMRRAMEIQNANQRLREANEELNRFQIQLEHRVHERTTQLARVNAALERENAERQRTEETLRASEERFRLMIEGVKEYAIFMLDLNGDIVTWNIGAERIIGYAGPEVRGQNYTIFFAAEDREHGIPRWELEQAARSGRYDSNGWRIRKDGSRFWATGILTALYNDKGDIRGFAKITRDLTEQHRIEERLKQMAAIVESSDDAIVSMSLSGIIESWNPAAECVYGYSAAEAIGRPFAMLVLPEGVGRLRERLSQVAKGEHVDPVETVRVRKDGQHIEVLSRFSQVLDANGSVIGVSAISRDISERRKLETQLRQSQKMEAFGQLAGGVAHDFNNLLTIINGYCEMIHATLDRNDPKTLLVQEVERAGERAASLTRQLLAFSRQQMLEPKVLNLNTIVREAEKLLVRLIGEDIQLNAVLAEDLSAVKVDPGQIEQVILNLALNGRDAMPQGGQLTIETRNVDLDQFYCVAHPEIQPGRYVLLATTDSGCGIGPEIKGRIFEPFFTTKGVGRGTGLGLSVVQGIVKQSGGTIEVYSESGVGSTFKVYLPAVEELGWRPTSSRPSMPSRGTETILLVEDEDAVRELAALALLSCGYTVIKASCGRHALSLMQFRSEKIDILVTDVVMPELSGGKLAEVLCARFPGLKVLYMSGYTDDAIVRHGVLQQDVAFLQKPFTPNTLAKKVREVLDQK